MKALALALALLPGAAWAEDSLMSRAAWYAPPAGLDALSTELALARGGTEWNPLLQERPVRLALQALSVPALAWLDREVERRSPGLQWVLRGLRWAVALWAVRRNLWVR